MTQKTRKCIQSNQQSINDTVKYYFDNNFKRQDAAFNTTLLYIANLTEGQTKVLLARIPLFEALLQDVRLSIHNQYQFSKQLNVSGISNKTDNLDLSQVPGYNASLMNDSHT